MRVTPWHITAPALGMPGRSEFEVLSDVTWLWLHSPLHREQHVMALERNLSAPMKARQYILASVADSAGTLRPVAFLAWANFSAEAEGRYMQGGSSDLLHKEDWNSGDRMWLTDWVAPFGDAGQFHRLVATLLADSCLRILYQPDGIRAKRVKAIRGAKVSRTDAITWWGARPLPAPSCAA
jgi:cytolysin-activating lysine-acyltransferase